MTAFWQVYAAIDRIVWMALSAVIFVVIWRFIMVRGLSSRGHWQNRRRWWRR